MENAGQHFDRGRLARAIWSKERYALSLANGERNAFNGNLVRIMRFDQ